MALKNVEDFYPLSAMQKGMLYHSLMTPDATVYVNQFVCTLEGQLQVEALERAWKRLIDRHAVLRTAFLWKGVKEPIQVIHRQTDIQIIRRDLRHLSPDEQEKEYQLFLNEDLKRGFDLSKPPLIRLLLIQKEKNVIHLAWTYHHLLLDGWSLSLMLQELVSLYQAETQNKEIHLERIRPYREYITWLKRQDLQSAETFWKEKLAGVVPMPSLPIEQSLPADGKKGAFVEEIRMSPESTRILLDFSRKHQLTLNTLVQGGWAFLLSRYIQEEEVIFGCVVSGRPSELAGCEKMIGMFVNTLPVRVRILQEMPLVSWLEELQEQLLEMRQFEYTPLTSVKDWIGISSNELFKSIIAFENYPIDENLAQWDDHLVIREVHSLEQTNYPLNVVAMPGEELLLKVLYEPDRFSEDTVKRMLQHLVTLLENIPLCANSPLEEWSMLTQNERSRMLIEWNRTHTKYPREKSLANLFEETVSRFPNHVAIEEDGMELTYSELNRRTNQLAWHLQKLGVKDNELVGICMNRSSSFVIAMLGVLKAGGVYLPLDPDYPADRLAMMLEDAKVRVVLTLEKWADRLPMENVQPVILDLEQSLGDHGEENPANEATGENLAYVIYTSGSTGKPKGVAVPQRAVARLVIQTNYVEITCDDRMAHASNVSFDAATFEIWGTLLHGARLICIPKEVVLSPPDLERWLIEKKISILFLTTALFHQMARLVPQALSHLRYLLFGGEAIDPEAVRELLKIGGPEHLYHVYGPTESTTFTTWYPVKEVPEQAKTIPIGKPISSTRCYVLDKFGQPVPVGVPGELYIAGDGLALGYLNDAELTSEKFVNAPVGIDEELLYRTGDCVRFLPEGNIEFIARFDHQVKIRGYRIELEEISGTIMRHEYVKDSVVLVREDKPGEKRLIAYVVVKQTLTEKELIQFMKQWLPDYMLPNSIVFMESFPLNANGKIDRRALPAPSDVIVAENLNYVPPQTDTEKTLVKIWEELLGKKPIGVQDHFLQIGGDSILAIQMVSRANKAGIPITLKDLLTNPTIKELAKVKASSFYTMDRQEPLTGEVALLPIQNWFFAQNLPNPEHFNMAVLLRTRERFEEEWLKEAFHALLKHHDALRFRYKQERGLWKQAYAPAGETVSIEWINLSDMDEKTQQQWIQKTASRLQKNLNLDKGPLVRVAYFQNPSANDYLLIVIHHLCVDGVSWRLLIEDLQTAYQQLKKGESVQLPPKTSSLKRWADALRQYAYSKELEQEIPYWCELPDQVEPMPVDFPEGINDEGSVNTIQISFTKEETERFMYKRSQQNGVKVQELLLTALVQSWKDWTQQSSLLIELEGHGREQIWEEIDLTRTVGWFTSVYPVWIALKEGNTLRDHLKGVQETLGKLSNNGLGYGVLRYLRKDSLTSLLACKAKAQVSFNYLGQFDQLFPESSLFEDLSYDGVGEARDPKGKRSYLIDINASIYKGSLNVEWRYSRNLHQRETIEQWTRMFKKALEEYIYEKV